VALARQQLLGADEEAPALGLLLARVRDRVGLRDDLLAPVFFEAPAAVFAAAPAPFDVAAFTAPLAVRADVRVDLGAAAAFV